MRRFQEAAEGEVVERDREAIEIAERGPQLANDGAVCLHLHPSSKRFRTIQQCDALDFRTLEQAKAT